MVCRDTESEQGRMSWDELQDHFADAAYVVHYYHNLFWQRLNNSLTHEIYVDLIWMVL